MTLFVVQVESVAKRNPHIILIVATEKEIADNNAEGNERIGYCCHKTKKKQEVFSHVDRKTIFKLFWNRGRSTHFYHVISVAEFEPQQIKLRDVYQAVIDE